MSWLDPIGTDKAIETGGNVLTNFFNGKNDVKKHEMSCKADVQKRKIEAVETVSLGGLIVGGIVWIASMFCDSFNKKDEFEVGIKRGGNSFNARGKNKY